MPPVERVLLARHAESEFSVRGLTNGDPELEVALTERGREQARLLGRSLADTEIDLCAVSEFQRTHETADLALEGRDVPRRGLRAESETRWRAVDGRLLAA